MTSLGIDHPAVHRAGSPPRRRARRSSKRVRNFATTERRRRALNVVVAAIVLVLTAPLMAIITALIKLTSHGPVLYTQIRVGLDRRGLNGANGRNSRRCHDLGGHPFQIYKFRTMAPDQGGGAEAQVWAAPDDPRVTPVGRVLRKYRLDELPQLWNVLHGDMNIVGPRPEQPQIFRDLRTQITTYEQRQSVPPGITGWAQINHHYDRDLEDVRRKVAFDLEYITRVSVLEDLKIMALTVPVIMARRGAW